MPSPAANRRIDERLAALHDRHRPEGDAPFAISLVGLDGEGHHAGDAEHRFPLQSISKVFAYAQALEDRGRDAVHERVGVEPSGDAFNSIVFDRPTDGPPRPHNPMVNAGALVTTSLVEGADDDERLARVLAEVRTYAGAEVEVDEAVAQDELGRSDHNRATAYLLREHGALPEGTDVESLLLTYLRQCAISMTCPQLALMAATLANGGVNPVTGERALGTRRLRDVLSVMHTCGMYDFAGQWAFEVGVPAKSGVSGGIMAVIPGKLGLAVFSPELDPHGNSVAGVAVCREVSEVLGLHVFAAEEEDELLRDPR